MTSNLRFDNPADGENRWRHRRDFVAEIIADEADLVGLQEARRCPLGWLDRHLPDFDWVGVGRANGKRRGEYSPIFYRTARFGRLDLIGGKAEVSKDEVGGEAALRELAGGVRKAAVERDDLAPFERLLLVLVHPFDEHAAYSAMAGPAPAEQTENYRTFCGT